LASPSLRPTNTTYSVTPAPPPSLLRPCPERPPCTLAPRRDRPPSVPPRMPPFPPPAPACPCPRCCASRSPACRFTHPACRVTHPRVPPRCGSGFRLAPFLKASHLPRCPSLLRPCPERPPCTLAPRRDRPPCVPPRMPPFPPCLQTHPRACRRGCRRSRPLLAFFFQGLKSVYARARVQRDRRGREHDQHGYAITSPLRTLSPPHPVARIMEGVTVTGMG
jgi:hypothetical protein